MQTIELEFSVFVFNQKLEQELFAFRLRVNENYKICPLILYSLAKTFSPFRFPIACGTRLGGKRSFYLFYYLSFCLYSVQLIYPCKCVLMHIHEQ